MLKGTGKVIYVKDEGRYYVNICQTMDDFAKIVKLMKKVAQREPGAKFIICNASEYRELQRNVSKSIDDEIKLLEDSRKKCEEDNAAFDQVKTLEREARNILEAVSKNKSSIGEKIKNIVKLTMVSSAIALVAYVIAIISVAFIAPALAYAEFLLLSTLGVCYSFGEFAYDLLSDLMGFSKSEIENDAMLPDNVQNKREKYNEQMAEYGKDIANKHQEKVGLENALKQLAELCIKYVDLEIADKEGVEITHENHAEIVGSDAAVYLR